MVVRATFAVSLDGFMAGHGPSLRAPFGHAGLRLLEWLIPTRARAIADNEDPAEGTDGVDNAFATVFFTRVGAEIMGAGKFGPPGWQDDPSWRGWWGENPPFHAPTFVLTHRPRPSIEMEGGTSFHFINETPQSAIERATVVAGDRDILIGGGPTMAREFLAERLIQVMHVAVIPILLGRGTRLWDGLEGLEADYAIETVAAPSAVAHLTFTRR
jgi:dihydrofolate reductase